MSLGLLSLGRPTNKFIQAGSIFYNGQWRSCRTRQFGVYSPAIGCCALVSGGAPDIFRALGQNSFLLLLCITSIFHYNRICFSVNHIIILSSFGQGL